MWGHQGPDEAAVAESTPRGLRLRDASRAGVPVKGQPSSPGPGPRPGHPQQVVLAPSQCPMVLRWDQVQSSVHIPEGTPQNSPELSGLELSELSVTPSHPGMDAQRPLTRPCSKAWRCEDSEGMRGLGEGGPWATAVNVFPQELWTPRWSGQGAVGPERRGHWARLHTCSRSCCNQKA